MAAPSIRVESVGAVAVLRMARGRANALDTAMCRELTERFSESALAGHRAAVLTGGGDMFCAGVDLLRARDGGAAYLTEFLPALVDAFLAVLRCPVPVVAAVNGHAVAGGCILTCACDHAVMNAEAGRIGVTELLVGVPFPVAALEIVRFAVGTHRLQQLTHTGQTYPAVQAAEIGLVDEVVPAESVLPRAIEVAAQLAGLPPEPLRHTRAQIRRPVLERIAADRASDDETRAMWCSPAAQQAISDYVSRVLRKG
jgi:enoyl-CoA hydratase